VLVISGDMDTVSASTTITTVSALTAANPFVVPDSIIRRSISTTTMMRRKPVNTMPNSESRSLARNHPLLRLDVLAEIFPVLSVVERRNTRRRNTTRKIIMSQKKSKSKGCGC